MLWPTLIVLAGALAGVLAALLTLPGVWLMLLVAVACQWWWGGEVYSWWTLGACVAVAIAGEVVEVVSGAVGAKKGGGSRQGAIGALIGAVLGAIVGIAIPVPVVGSLIGSVIGAGVGAVVGEMVFAKRTGLEAAKSGTGAALGRLVAVVVKTAIAAGVGVVLVVAAAVP